MTSTTFFIIFIPILAIILLVVNLILAPHNPYQEKDSVFECGFHSFLGQNRTQFSISFFIFGLLFLLFDLEILLVYPYSVSSYTNDIYGLAIMMVFFVLLTLGFVFELGKNALSIDSKQIFIFRSKDKSNPDTYTNLSLSIVWVSTFLNKVSYYLNKYPRIVNTIIYLLTVYWTLKSQATPVYCQSGPVVWEGYEVDMFYDPEDVGVPAIPDTAWTVCDDCFGVLEVGIVSCDGTSEVYDPGDH